MNAVRTLASGTLIGALIVVVVVFGVRLARRGYVATTWAYGIGRQGAEVSQEEMGSIAMLARTPQFARLVRDDGGIPLVPRRIQADLNVAQPSGTTLLEMQASATDGPESRKLDQAAFTVLSRRVRTLWGNLRLQRVQSAQALRVPVRWTNAVAAFVALLAALGVASASIVSSRRRSLTRRRGGEVRLG